MEPFTWAFMTILILLNNVQSFSGARSDRVLLTDVKALTLHDGEMTKYRRTSPVPELKCVGGSAAGAFRPKTVQCINRGSNGYDVQWECKTDIDNSYRFGQVEVTCEGYGYPKDPYILRGSCGLEYTLEFTEEGWARKAAQGFKKYFSWNHYAQISNTSQISFMQGLVFLLIIAVFTYFIYKKCIAKTSRPPKTPRDNPPSYEETVASGDYDHDNRQQPPPPVSKTENTKATTSSANHSSGTRTSSGVGGTSRRNYTETTTPDDYTTDSTSTTTVPNSTETTTASAFGGTNIR